MSTAVMLERMAEASPRIKARIAGVFYLLSFVTGIFAPTPLPRRAMSQVILLFYHLSLRFVRDRSLQAGDRSGSRAHDHIDDTTGYTKRVTRPVVTSAAAQIKSKLNHALRRIARPSFR